MALFAAWTLFVWGGRLRNVVRDLGDEVPVGAFPVVASAVFSVLALVVLAVFVALPLLGRPPGPATAAAGRVVVWLLAAATVVVWLVRGVSIALGDRSVGFILVHLVLAAVSIGLAGLVVTRRSAWALRP